MTQLVNAVKTMLSIEIVKIINELREEDSAELLHKNFTVKIVKVLGEEHSAKFLAQYKDSTGRTLVCYALPKREANLMVMSESYKVQAAVYDKMVELEEQKAKPLSQIDLLVQSALVLQAQELRLAMNEAKVEVIAAQVADLQVDLRNGVPHGYVSKANALRLYGRGLSKAIFEAVMTEYDVKTQAYVHYAEGHSVATFGYLENIIPDVIEHFISTVTQATPNQCFSDKLNKRFNYKKPTLQ